ncbi:MAG TPA: polysaccharide deacetylase family protein [Egibacteraceae bacterium]|nr:polysaccharide deacetylase family protein [Egibacteraceae bacterium]
MGRRWVPAAAVVLQLALTAPAYAQTAKPALTAPKPGAVVRGTVGITAEVPSTDVATIEVSVDGGETWQALETAVASSTAKAAWDTSGYDGKAAIRVRTLVSGNDRISVTVDNTSARVRLRAPDVFSPNGDGRKDHATVVVRSSEQATATVSVRRRTRVLRRFRPQALGDQPLRLVWRGHDDRGRRASDGRYTIVAVVADRAGNVTRARTRVRLDTTPPALRLHRLPSPTDARSPISVGYRVGDAAGTVRLTATLRSRVTAIRSRSVRRATGVDALRLRARHRDGSRLFPGEYRVALRAVDPGRNATVRRRRLVVLRPTTGRVYTRLEDTGRRVALTFDDCHVATAWERILDTLKREKVKATFFCPGNMLETFPELGRRTVRDGHVPASHTWGHVYLTSQSYSSVVDRLRRDRRAWWRLGGVSAPYMRPPYGAYNSTTVAAAGAASHPRVMMWDVDSRDTAGASGSTLVCNVVCRAQPGSVILLHTKTVTADALPAILDGLRRRHLRPVTLPRLFHAAGLP